jgi:hypothetical protein
MTAAISTDPMTLAGEFTKALPARARRYAPGAQALYPVLVAAMRRGWDLATVARGCSRGAPSAALISSRLDWYAEHDPQSQTRPAKPPATSLYGCEHTSDPNGWVMDDAGNITGKCACWAPVLGGRS